MKVLKLVLGWLFWMLVAVVLEAVLEAVGVMLVEVAEEVEWEVI